MYELLYARSIAGARVDCHAARCRFVHSVFVSDPFAELAGLAFPFTPSRVFLVFVSVFEQAKLAEQFPLSNVKILCAAAM